MPSFAGLNKFNPAFQQGAGQGQGFQGFGQDFGQGQGFQNPFQNFLGFGGIGDLQQGLGQGQGQGFQNPFQGFDPFQAFDFATQFEPGLLGGSSEPSRVTPAFEEPPTPPGPKLTRQMKINDTLRDPNSRFNKELGRVPFGAR